MNCGLWSYINDIHRSSNQMCFVHLLTIQPFLPPTVSSAVFVDSFCLWQLTTVTVFDSVFASIPLWIGVDSWLKSNRLSLNVSKTSFMIISDQKNARDITNRDSILTKVSTAKFLGVTLDENIYFTDHVNKVATKITKSVGVMKRLHCRLHADVTVN